MPQLFELEGKIPSCAIEFIAEADQPKIHDLSFDVYVDFDRPGDLDCIATRMGLQALCYFALIVAPCGTGPLSQ